MSVQALAAAGGSGKDSPHKILVVDDERYILRLLQVNLERAGYEVVCALSKQEAFDKISAEWPDAAILDASLPEPDGYEILRQIRSEPSLAHLKVILLLDNASEAEITRARQFGADYVVTKPFSPAELSGLLRGF